VFRSTSFTEPITTCPSAGGVPPVCQYKCKDHLSCQLLTLMLTKEVKLKYIFFLETQRSFHSRRLSPTKPLCMSH